MRYGNCVDGYFGHGINYGMNYFRFDSYTLVIVGVVVILTLLFAVFIHNKKRSSSSNEPEKVLKMRYVNGEITEDEYRKMKKMIH